MELTVIGCAGSFPNAGSPASCYLLEHEGYRIVLDIGSGAFGGLQAALESRQVAGAPNGAVLARSRVALAAPPAAPDLVDSVSAILLSHLHADHCMDLTGWYVHRRYRLGGQPDGLLPVYGPPGAAARMARAYDLPLEPGMGEVFEFVDFPTSFDVGPFHITVAQVNHPVPAFGFRITAGSRTLAYTGDSGWCPALVELAESADLLLAEASFLGDNNPADLHLTAAQAGELADLAGADRLLLTHLVSWNAVEKSLAEASSRFSGPVSAAHAGLVVVV